MVRERMDLVTQRRRLGMPTTKKKQRQQAAKGRQSKKTKTEETALSRPVVYPEIESVIHHATGDNPITSALAKQILGWQEEDEKTPFGNKHLGEISRVYGTKVRCNNNVTNRPIYIPVIETLKQEHLRGRWRFNGEPIIVGSTGMVLNGQHTLLSLILAVKEWEEHPDRWPHWETAPTMDKLIVYGVEESDEVVNTMDTCKPRTLADVIYRAHYFKDLPYKAQKAVARMTDHAIKKLWSRTGVHSNAYAVKRTHAESVAFLSKHPQLLKAVRHIYEEDSQEGKIAKYMSPGYAAATLFLMGCSNSVPEDYYTAEDPNETLLNWDNWDRACEFFVELAGGAAGMKPVREEIGKLLVSGSNQWIDRFAVFANAWHAYANRKPITAKLVALDFVIKDDERRLVEEPVLGGIDVGEEGLHFVADGDPSETEVAERAAKVQEKKSPKKKVARRAGATWAKGDKAWVHGGDDGAYFAELSGDPFETQGGGDKVFVDAEDGNWEVAVTDLSLNQFNRDM